MKKALRRGTEKKKPISDFFPPEDEDVFFSQQKFRAYKNLVRDLQQENRTYKIFMKEQGIAPPGSINSSTRKLHQTAPSSTIEKSQKVPPRKHRSSWHAKYLKLEQDVKFVVKTQLPLFFEEMERLIGKIPFKEQEQMLGQLNLIRNTLDSLMISKSKVKSKSNKKSQVAVIQKEKEEENKAPTPPPKKKRTSSFHQPQLPRFTKPTKKSSSRRTISDVKGEERRNLEDCKTRSASAMNPSRLRENLRKLKKSASVPNLNLWELPSEKFSGYEPPILGKDDGTKRVGSDLQAIVKRQENIRSSVQYSPEITNPHQFLTFTFTESMRPLLLGGQVKQMFQWILERSTDWVEVETLLLCHRFHCSSADAFRILLNWFEEISVRAPSMKFARSFSVLDKWMAYYSSDFIDADAREAVIEFIESVRFVDKTGAEQLLQKLNDIKQEPQKPFPLDKDKSYIHPRDFTSIDLLQFPALEVAKYFCNREFIHFKRIQWKDLISKHNRENSPSIDFIIKKFTSCSLWVATQIVSTAHTKKRAAIIQFFIRVAEHSFALHNFVTLSAIIASLNMASIQQLKKTWKAVPKYAMDSFADLESYVMPFNNFAKYRAALEKSPVPCLPFMGVICRDLTHVEEGNPDLLPNGHINLEKMRMLTTIIRDIRAFQAFPYDYEISPQVATALKDLHWLQKLSIAKLSARIEPRDC